MPRVSVLIPTYSRPERLRGCIDAALASHFRDIEVVVGDDGLMGRAVCESVTDERLRYVANPARLGMARNWNSLLDDARGELLCLCMDDDRLAPDYAMACVAAFDANPELGVVFTNHFFADDRGNLRVRKNDVSAGRHDSFARELMTHRPVAVSAAMLRRDAWTGVRPLPDTAAADMVLFGRLAEAGWPFHYIDVPLMTYHTHDGMLSGTPAFRTASITAWSSLRFSDPVAEQLRRRVLRDAFVARAKLDLQQGRRSDARIDLRRAARLTGARDACQFVVVCATSIAPSPLIAAAASLRRRGRQLIKRH